MDPVAVEACLGIDTTAHDAGAISELDELGIDTEPAEMTSRDAADDRDRSV